MIQRKLKLAAIAAILVAVILYLFVEGTVVVRASTTEEAPDLQLQTANGWTSFWNVGGTKFVILIGHGDRAMVAKGRFRSRLREIPFGYATSAQFQYIRLNIDQNGEHAVSSYYFP